MVPARLQEQEVLDALRKAMDEHPKTIMNGQQITPHILVAHLNPNDLKRLTARRPALDENFALDLKRMANGRGYLFTGALKVILIADPRVMPGRLDCEALTDSAAAPSNGDATVTIDPGVLPVPPIAVQIPPAWLTLFKPSKGQPMLIDRPEIRIGRHNTNDIIVNERRVSRFHAEVKYERGQFMLYDLSSVNGVLLNGAPIRRAVALQDRDIVGVCGYEFIFQRR
jgi:hypothetical protein